MVEPESFYEATEIEQTGMVPDKEHQEQDHHNHDDPGPDRRSAPPAPGLVSRRVHRELASHRRTLQRISLRGDLCRPPGVDAVPLQGDSEITSAGLSSIWFPMLAKNRAKKTGATKLTDFLITGTVLVGSLALLDHGPGSKLDLTGAALAAASSLPLLVWRRAPLGVFVFTAAASSVAAAAGYALHELWVPLGPTVALYLLAAGGAGQKRSGWQLLAITTALLATYAAASTVTERTFPWLALFHAGLSWAVAWFAGERTRLLRERMAQLEGRALQAEREAEQERRLAVAEERARIARDLHDSAGHAINVIAVRAGAARLRHREEPERSLAALQAIEVVARQTAADIDRIVHALRMDELSGSDPAAPLGLASLGTLVTHHQQAGLDVSVHSRGEPRPLPPSIDQAAYRILQEALTNATRHGGGAVDIELLFEKTALDLTVTNPVPEDGRPPSRPGHGLIGMRERALMLGGTMDARGGDGVFRVCARIPYAGRED